MLSGSFRTYPISSITVAPDRQRKELAGIPELAASIRQFGLIHPIVITPDGQLVAGERRLRAHEHLGLTHIPVQFTNELDTDELEVLELEENVKRKALGWKEEVEAVARLHSMKMQKEEGWTKEATAELLSVTDTTINRYLVVNGYLQKGEPLVVEAANLTTAFNICSRKEQRAEVAEEERFEETFEKVFSNPISITQGTKKTEAPTLPLETPKEIIPYINEDFRKWATTPWTGPKFNFIHCDFPYGINFDKHSGGATGLLGGYEDSPELYLECLRALRACMADRVAESAHLMFWLSARHEIIHQTRLALADMGWKVAAVPLIWHRSDNSGILPDPQRGPRQVYEVCLHASRGDRKIVQAVSNLFAHPKTKDVHASEKPRAMLQHFFRMFIDESTVMLDPTMGSGNSILAAEEAEAKFVLGIEVLHEIFNNAIAYRKKVKRRD